MDLKKDILWRVYLVYFVVCVFAIVIITKIFTIQFVEGEELRKRAQNLTTAFRNIDALRGNIYAADGSLLATSVPIYEVRMDVNSSALSDEIFYKGVDSLAYCLSKLFDDKSHSEYKKELTRARKNGERYFLIKRKVRYTELKKLKTFPLLRLGKYKGGLIYIQQNKREMPFKFLAARTLGYELDGVKPVGLEGAYNNYLKGVSGKRLEQKIAGNVWMPLNDENQVEPQDGSDLITTLDVNFQDVAQSALQKQLIKHNADHGCAVLMEVKTGEIKAIANFTKVDSGFYAEKFNYAIGESTEPGSTFKLASIICALEDGLISLDDIIDTKDGTMKYYDRTMNDSHEGGYGKITVQRAFEVSSNVGISKLISNCYAKDPQRFIDRLEKMNLGAPLKFEISGEGIPHIKNPKDKDWYGTTLPWMSIGYELKQTPLQTLAFYNAVANNGKMVKPHLVKEIQRTGKTEKSFSTTVIDESICSKETILKVKRLLEGVVDSGTAKNIRCENYKIAGKTGTAQIANKNKGYKGTKTTYLASFAGYFPADDPKYSCIVVISNPSTGLYYGNQIAAPVFKEISDKVYANSFEFHGPPVDGEWLVTSFAPVSQNSRQEDLKKVFSILDVEYSSDNLSTEWVQTSATEMEVKMNAKTIKEGLVPNVVGMGITDAIYLLENNGLTVKFKGKGAVKKQSLSAGTKIIKGSKIFLELS